MSYLSISSNLIYPSPNPPNENQAKFSENLPLIPIRIGERIYPFGNSLLKKTRKFGFKQATEIGVGGYFWYTPWPKIF